MRLLVAFCGRIRRHLVRLSLFPTLASLFYKRGLQLLKASADGRFSIHYSFNSLVLQRRCPCRTVYFSRVEDWVVMTFRAIIASILMIEKALGRIISEA
jgi:hypothetical protein